MICFRMFISTIAILFFSHTGMYGAAFQEVAPFVQPVPALQHSLGISFAKGMIAGAILTPIVIGAIGAMDQVDTVFPLYFGSMIIGCTGPAKCAVPYDQFYQNYTETGEKILIERFGNRIPYQTREQFCIAYAQLRKKLALSESTEDEERTCDQLLRSDLTRSLHNKLTRYLHNKLYDEALDNLKVAQFIRGCALGQLVGPALLIILGSLAQEYCNSQDALLL